MAFRLPPSAVAAGYGLRVFEAVGSTNAEALEAAHRGEQGPVWFVSDRQEAGRGRRGRVWATEKGNLAATLLLAPDVEMGSAATLGFVAGLALSDALGAVAPAGRISVAPDGGTVAGQGPQRRFELKWPNDVLASGAKLAGILLESSSLQGGGNALAVGIGVNVVSAPADVPYPATSLAALGANCDAQALFFALADAWTDAMRAWNGGRGLTAIRERWLARAAGLGSEVAVRVEGGVERGLFETIDEDCRFVIRAADGRMIRITAGDVHFGAVASAASQG